MTAGQMIAGLGILLAVLSFFVVAFPLLPIAVILIGAAKFVP